MDRLRNSIHSCSVFQAINRIIYLESLTLLDRELDDESLIKNRRYWKLSRKRYQLKLRRFIMKIYETSLLLLVRSLRATSVEDLSRITKIIHQLLHKNRKTIKLFGDFCLKLAPEVHTSRYYVWQLSQKRDTKVWCVHRRTTWILIFCRYVFEFGVVFNFGWYDVDQLVSSSHTIT